MARRVDVPAFVLATAFQFPAPNGIANPTAEKEPVREAELLEPPPECIRRDVQRAGPARLWRFHGEDVDRDAGSPSQENPLAAGVEVLPAESAGFAPPRAQSGGDLYEEAPQPILSSAARIILATSSGVGMSLSTLLADGSF